AMVDAAIGGKTGVDLPEGKNLLGAFHQPRAVVCDMALLASLPEAEWRNGMAEVIKTAIVGDAALFAELVSASSTLEALRTDYARSAEVVRRCVEVKGGIVMRDERESGERMQLNAGHTIGHAIEAASHYRLPHGQAVAIGLALEARVAQQLGLADASFVADLDRLLAHYGLPTTPPDDLVNMAQPFLRFDKKRHAGKTRYALPCAPGSVRVVDDVDAAVVEAVLLGKAG
ncbi:MAG: 3-dehydroquinate synthase family protein, partial [Planctomycetota bacterium]